MMMTMKRWQDEYLKLMARIEEPVVRFTEEASEQVAEYVPERPEWKFLAELPTVTEFVESQLKFRRRVVDEQAAFVRRMMKAMQPALEKIDHKAPKKVAPKAAPTRRTAAKAS
jgi:hypothetical protein